MTPECGTARQAAAGQAVQNGVERGPGGGGQQRLGLPQGLRMGLHRRLPVATHKARQPPDRGMGTARGAQRIAPVLAIEGDGLGVEQKPAPGPGDQLIKPPVMIAQAGRRARAPCQCHGGGVQRHRVPRKQVLHQRVAEGWPNRCAARSPQGTQGRIDGQAGRRIEGRLMGRHLGQCHAGAGQFGCKPDVVLIGKGNRAAGQVGMRQHRQEILCGTASRT